MRNPSPLAVLPPGVRLCRHAHDAPYAAIVLDGGYDEAGEIGRWRARPGDVLLHGAFSAHCNAATGRGAKVLNLALPFSAEDSRFGCIDDPDAIMRLTEKDPGEAAEALLAAWRPVGALLADGPDLLAAALRTERCSVLPLAQAEGVCRQTVFRWFRSAYGVSPTRYRLEVRARRAWCMIARGEASMAAVASDCGFADQAHMNRHLKSLTGRTPGQWRNTLQPTFKTGA